MLFNGFSLSMMQLCYRNEKVKDLSNTHNENNLKKMMKYTMSVYLYTTCQG